MCQLVAVKSLLSLGRFRLDTCRRGTSWTVPEVTLLFNLIVIYVDLIHYMYFVIYVNLFHYMYFVIFYLLKI